MLQRYREVYRTPGTAAFCAASFVARLPLAIYPLAIVLLISARDGRYGFAGALAACYTFGNAAGQPVLSALVDRFGQRRLLVPCTAVHVVALGVLAILLHARAPNWSLVLPVTVFGFSYLSATSLVRARWAFTLEGSPDLTTALSVEAVLEEVVFIIGPPIATVLATHAAPALVLYLGGGLVAVGSLWLAALRDTEPLPHPPDGTGRASALRTPGLAALIPVTFGIGVVFATGDVSIIAFCGQHGQRSLSGVVLAVAAVGSTLAGLVYGALPRRGDVLRRFRLQLMVFAAMPLVLLGAPNVAVLIAAGFVLGTGTAPMLIALYDLIHQLVPARALTEGLAWVSAGVRIGLGIGASIVGGVADHHGARAGFLVVVAAAGAVAVLGLTARLSSPGSGEVALDPAE